MSVTSGFYNSLYSIDGHDRLYHAGEMSKLFDGLIVDGVYLSSKPEDPYNQQFKTTAADIPGMKVVTKPGRAWFNGRYVILKETTEYSINSSGANDRIDALVIEMNFEDRAASIKVITGLSNERPTMVHSDVIDQYPIAFIKVRGETTTIEEYDVEYVVGIDTPYFAWLGENLNISQLYSKWKSSLGRTIMGFEPWLDAMRRMIGWGDFDYYNIKAEIEAVNADPYIMGIFPKVNELVQSETGDGTTTDFTLGDDANVLADILIDGSMVFNYTYNNNVVSFTEAPENGADIQIYYVPNTLKTYTIYFEEDQNV